MQVCTRLRPQAGPGEVEGQNVDGQEVEGHDLEGQRVDGQEAEGQELGGVVDAARRELMFGARDAEVEMDVPRLGEEVELAGDRNPFPCTECDKSYTTKRCLRGHKKYKHGDPSTCTECGKNCGSKMQLASHVRDSHSPRLHICTLCGRRFSRKRDLERHLVPCAKGKGRKSSRPDPKFACEMCGKFFATKDSLGHHFKRQHKVELQKQPTAVGRRFLAKYFPRRRRREAAWKCKKCSQSFRRNGHLKQHMKVHKVSAVLVDGAGGEAEDSPNFVCEVCALEFGSKNVLMNHMAVLHPTLSFKCDQCDKELQTKNSLKQHRSRQHKDTVFQCPLCLAEFRQKQNRKAHMKRCKEGEIKKPKSWSDLTPNGKTKKRKELRKKFLQDTMEMSEAEKKTLLKGMVKDCPDFLETFVSNPLTTDDILDIVRDCNTSNNQVIKIIVKLNRKWKGCVSPKIREALTQFHRTLDHLFTSREVRGDEELHFQDTKGNPLNSRWVTYCNDLDTLLGAQELEEGEEMGDNVFGIDDGKKVLKLIWNTVKRGEVGPKGKVGGGVKFCQVLFAVAGVKETYHNIKVSPG